MHFISSLETRELSSFFALGKTPESSANAAPIPCALNTLPVMQTALRHVHIAVVTNAEMVPSIKKRDPGDF